MFDLPIGISGKLGMCKLSDIYIDGNNNITSSCPPSAVTARLVAFRILHGVKIVISANPVEVEIEITHGPVKCKLVTAPPLFLQLAPAMSPHLSPEIPATDI